MNLLESLSYVMRLLLLPSIATGLVFLSALLILRAKERWMPPFQGNVHRLAR